MKSVSPLASDLSGRWPPTHRASKSEPNVTFVGVTGDRSESEARFTFDLGLEPLVPLAADTSGSQKVKQASPFPP
jgi:hypothetical protein